MQIPLFGDKNTRKPIVLISKTDFIDFQKCRYTWYMRKVQQVKVPPTESMIKGTNMHNVAKDINDSLRKGKLKNFDEVLNFVLSLDLESGVRCGIENFVRYLKGRYEGNLPYVPRIVEEKIEYDMKDGYRIVGIPDVVYFDSKTNSFEVVEYKKSVYRDEEEILLEAMFYGYILEKSRRFKVEKVSFVSFDDGYTKSKEYSKSEIEKKIFDMIGFLDGMDFEPNPSEDVCKVCVFRKYCPYAKG
jgi:CRISPR/Cas system-associated exonuclease Cas4 (RecB family)